MKPGTTIFLILCITASGCISTDKSPENREKNLSVEVSRVVDGDTVEVVLNGSKEDIRLIGVDTPEVHVEVDPAEYEGIPTNETGEKCLEKWGEKASNYAKGRISGTVELEVSTNSGKIDRGSYDRILGEIWVNNTSFNRQLVLDGYARSYSTDGPYMREEVEAIRNNRGLWGCTG
ncbi:MAG: thermonuclease family protein [Nanohaloarchaea archaeon]|nr:thermonuclease family protein [Candidatus Nanohaloarchaea archaeon]